LQIIEHSIHPREEWRPGVLTRMRASAMTGMKHVCIFEQWCDPKNGAPTHKHPVEELLTVLDGEAEVWLEAQSARLKGGQSLRVPANTWHGFTNAGEATLHLEAVLGSGFFEAILEDQRVVRRWVS
jgi:mannose-6-phosphate isomerase-like protein (cupin superfamily)